MDMASNLRPTDLDYPEPDWTTRSTTITEQKIADLNAQVVSTPRDIAIRDQPDSRAYQQSLRHTIYVEDDGASAPA